MTAAEQAETYLRLMAESELRQALGYPRREPPAPSSHLPAVASAVRLSGPLLAPLLPPVRTAARVSGPLLASLWPAPRPSQARTGSGWWPAHWYRRASWASPPPRRRSTA